MIMNQKHFENGVLVKEIRDGTSIKSNLGKTPARLTAEIIALRKNGSTPIENPNATQLIAIKRPSKSIEPVPYSDWPLWVKAVSKFAKSEDKGIGDVVARTIGAENSEAFKKWFKATTGKDCGCTGRQRRWNIEYPL